MHFSLKTFILVAVVTGILYHTNMFLANRLSDRFHCKKRKLGIAIFFILITCIEFGLFNLVLFLLGIE